MTALIGPGPDEAVEICETARGDGVLAVANENASNQVVLSGSVSAIERAEEEARRRGARTIRLNVAGAFHSPLMETALEPIRRALADLTFGHPRIPIVANVTGGFVEGPTAERELLVRHVVSPVRWERSMRTLVEAGFDTFVEAGPGQVLSKLVKRGFPGVRVAAIGSPEHAASFAGSLRGDGAP
jgi:[acyl-carrier-protein] S-malonyltransferase